MLFNSLEFAIFLPSVFLIYWFIVNRNLKLQNFFLLVVSYLFYGWWDWRFLILIILSSLLDYTVGILLKRTDNQTKRKWLLGISCAGNLGALGFFKYFNFFVDSFVNAFGSIGIHLEATTLNIILPVGISFYTFQTLSYTIDVYRKNMEPSTDVVSFFAYVAFFPQLVAGPIERASHLLPQFQKERKFDYGASVDGMRQILWGLFKKIVIADNCAPYVNEIFANYQTLPASTLVLGIIYFSVQIYCDFSGYSDIAIGSARLFGFSLMRNFAYPYFSRDIAEFWRRWHISLSTWFRDYVYIPLGGNRKGMSNTIKNVIIVFTVSGFWHGADFTFLAWGFLHGAYFVPLLVTGKHKSNLDIAGNDRLFPSLKEFSGICITFFLVGIAWVFFRAENIGGAFEYIGKLFSLSLFQIPSLFDLFAMPYVVLLFCIEWVQREKPHVLMLDNIHSRIIRWFIYLLIIFFIILAAPANKYEFIYFQF